MRRRLLRSTGLIALAAVLVLGVPLGFVGTAVLRQRADMRLERRADAAALRLTRAQARGVALTETLVAGVLRRRDALEVTSAGTTMTFGTVPADPARVRSGDAGPLEVTLLVPASERDDDVGIVWAAIGAAAVAALAAAAALAIVQARRLAAPLEQLVRRVERVGHVDFDGTPVAGQIEEIDRLQRALNEADERIADLVRHERQFTANVSHQLRSPLTALRMRLEELEQLSRTPSALAEVAAAQAQADRLVDTIEHLEDVARRRDDEPTALELRAALDEHVRTSGWPARFAHAGRVLSLAPGPPAPARVRGESVRQILDVLLDNALTHGVGATTIACRADDAFVRLRVSDEGPSPRGPARDALFLRGVGARNGIGLAVARDLARYAGGDLVIGDDATTTFEALLPAARRDPTLR